MTETNIEHQDPSDLSLPELRSLRQRLQHEDDVVSYARRVAQARLDLVSTELERRAARDGSDGGDSDISGEIEKVLSHHLTGGPARPPRPTEDLTDNTLIDELDELCAEHHYGRIDELDADQLAALSSAIEGFEAKVSSDRRQRFDRLDELSAELVRRYRSGEADVDSLLAD
ncbi:MAG: hypothetical protein HKN44_03115 [Ilumatobacter sp.]|nr:hypothetical protein [Ilumatobacter sp.]